MEVLNQNYMDEAVFKKVRKKGLLAFGIFGGILPIIFSYFGTQLLESISLIIFFVMCFIIFKSIANHTKSEIYDKFKSSVYSILIAILLMIVCVILAPRVGKISIFAIPLILYFVGKSFYKYFLVFIELSDLSDEKLFRICGILMLINIGLMLFSAFIAMIFLSVELFGIFFIVMVVIGFASLIVSILAWYKVRYFKVLPKLAD